MERKTLYTSTTSPTLVIIMQITIKNIQDHVFREFKAESVREGLKVGDSLTLAMKLWLEKSKKKPRMSLLDIKPRDWGKGTEKLSEEIDRIVY